VSNGVAVTPDGRKVYVANSGSNNVFVIDTATNAVIGSPIPVGLFPSGVAVTPDGRKVYVANRDSDNVSVIDTKREKKRRQGPGGRQGRDVSEADAGAATNTVIATIPVGSSPIGVAVTPDGSKVYVANSGSNNVFVIDTATNAVLAVVSVGIQPVAFGAFIQQCMERDIVSGSNREGQSTDAEHRDAEFMRVRCKEARRDRDDRDHSE
jgi:YVTN family beta-propeller protein